MKRTFVLIVMLGLLMANVACQRETTAQPRPSPSPLPETPTPTPAPTPTPTLSYAECGWNWATQPLPELSAELESVLQVTLPLPFEAHAEAFGENCFDGRTNQVAYFVARETDFFILVHVEDLADRERLGRLAEQILLTLPNNFPVETTPGPQPGYITLTFMKEAEELRLRLTWVEAESALASNLHGESLLNALESR